MKIERLRVKQEIILWDDYAEEGKEEFTLNVGEEYDVKSWSDEDIKQCPFTLSEEVYVPGHEHGEIDAWIQMCFDSEEEFWKFWERV